MFHTLVMALVAACLMSCQTANQTVDNCGCKVQKVAYARSTTVAPTVVHRSTPTHVVVQPAHRSVVVSPAPSPPVVIAPRPQQTAVVSPRFKPLVVGESDDLAEHIVNMRNAKFDSLASACEALMSGTPFSALTPRQQAEVKNFIDQSDPEIVAPLAAKVR